MCRLLILLLMLAPPALAEPPRLVFPVDCTLGRDCVLQQFMDHDPGPGARDFACGSAAYDGHSGTDIRISRADQRRGVDVLAPAAGVVVGIRDGMPDVLLRRPDGRRAVAGRECGNGVAIDHGGGWRSQLCHMARGSIAVEPGDRVVAGQVVGRIGMSGNTEFAHLQIRLEKDGSSVDPFAPDLAPGACEDGGGMLWLDADMAAAARQPTRLLAVGLADRAPALDTVLDGAFDGYLPLRDAPVVIWAVAINGQNGDRLDMRVSGPGGGVAGRVSDPLPRTKAQFFAFTGNPAPDGGWPPGDYRWTVSLMRAGAALDTRSGSFALR